MHGQLCMPQRSGLPRLLRQHAAVDAVVSPPDGLYASTPGLGSGSKGAMGSGVGVGVGVGVGWGMGLMGKGTIGLGMSIGYSLFVSRGNGAL